VILWCVNGTLKTPMAHDELADQLVQDIIRTMSRYANFRSYWRNTKRQDTIRDNLKKTIVKRLNQSQKNPFLRWD